MIIVKKVQDVQVNQKATQSKTMSAIPIIIIPMICSKMISTILSCNDFLGILFFSDNAVCNLSSLKNLPHQILDFAFSK